jgi:cation transport protein ChaC
VKVSRRQQRNLAEPTWVFGYGSLIYKVDFPYLERRIASITDWQRRFWQGSHDHRGTPNAPGRVVTLVPARAVICRGVAYRVEHSVFEHLDFREKNGYQRIPTPITLEAPHESVAGVVYVADRDNSAYLGPAPMTQLANHIAASHGPSGSNRDYVLQLAKALRELGDDDQHVLALETLLTGAEPD